MHRLVLLASLVAACGSTDNRPATLEYVTEAVLAPNCGNAQCHSTFHQVAGYAFDTLNAARDSIQENALVDLDSPSESFLLEVLTRPIDRMPNDQALPDADIDLIFRWIDNGAKGL